MSVSFSFLSLAIVFHALSFYLCISPVLSFSFNLPLFCFSVTQPPSPFSFPHLPYFLSFLTPLASSLPLSLTLFPSLSPLAFLTGLFKGIILFCAWISESTHHAFVRVCQKTDHIPFHVPSLSQGPFSCAEQLEPTADILMLAGCTRNVYSFRCQVFYSKM